MLRLDWIAVAMGVLGSLLLALRIPPAFGFMAYLVSSVAWIIVARRKGMPSLIAQHLFFIGTALLGLWNWCVGPLVLG
ncbi:MAG TPA: hypothetical protein VF555_16465 [Variovorax sp.]